MVLLWMILLVVLLCAELGTNVTLTCSNQTTEVHWYMEIHSQFRACIGRSLSSAATYCSPGFESKFSILGNKLVIKNFTAEDCRLYFCGIKRGGSIQFVETFHLVSDIPTTPDPDSGVLQRNPILVSSLSLNVVLILVICLSCVWLSLKRGISKNQANLPPAGTSERLETPQYEEIQFPPPSAAPLQECIYYKIQRPRSTLPQS
ncbi:RNA-binding protein with serine-rich domain 1 [Sarotherodon galilaeus]